MFGVIIWLIVIGVVILIIMDSKEKKRKEEERKRKEEKIQEEIQEEKKRKQEKEKKMQETNKINKRKVEEEKRKQEITKFYQLIYSFFNNKHETVNYRGRYSKLLSQIEKIEKINSEWPYEDKISGNQFMEYRKTAEQFKQFGLKVEKNITNRMFDLNNYGSINNKYLNYIMSMRKQDVDFIVKSAKRVLSGTEYNEIWKIDAVKAYECVWFYAVYKPYSSTDFEEAKEVFYKIYKDRNMEVFLAELYPIQQMGANNIVRDKITEFFKSCTGWYADKLNVENLTLLASDLMWMKAYNEEKIVLQEMLSRQMDMPAKLQERLHALSNGGENAPSDYDVQSNQSQIYLDTASLAWNDSEYNNFFENLSFKEKVLTYSLAIRDENKDLFITQAMNLPDNTKICSKLMTVFQEEYGSQVVARNVEGIALSGSGSEKIPGILVRTKECKQLGIFLHIARIGKKLNIKFYTLFVPITNDIGEQRQQVISLYKKLSPTVTMWEDSLKDTILMAIQQLLNVAPKPEQQPNHPVEDEPVEF